MSNQSQTPPPSPLPPNYKAVNLNDPRIVAQAAEFADEILASTDHMADAVAVAANVLAFVMSKAMQRGKDKAECLALRDRCAALLARMGIGTSQIPYEHIRDAQLFDLPVSDVTH